ncbi:MAG: acyltransferase family protein [Myxococcales bacterium]|nr:acyltransferase family protein [Myxococcales bacterium]
MSRGQANLSARVRENWLALFGDQSSDDLAKLDRLPTQLNEYGFDPFGFQPEFAKLVVPLFALIYRHYFRVKVYGIENLPAGRCLLIANHSGQIPLDGMMIGCSILLDADPPRFIRSMIERWIPSLPFVSVFFARLGQVVGTPENCERLLRRGEAILVFPEGSRGISKEFRRRYQLESFGLGFMRLALATETPIVPIAVVGAEEQAPSMLNFEALAKLLNMPSFPVTPTFPLLGPLGLLPLPVRYHIHFGEPLQFEGDPNDEEDEIGRKVEVVRSTIQRMLHDGLSQRQGLFR